jgi:NAD(P)-dependent dehydrogenase (short-subunit alcohol dehydrogenase family)
MEMKNKTALVDGGTSGLGLGVVKELARRGAHVAVLGWRGGLAREIASRFDRAFGLEADISDPIAVERAVEAALERFGALHINVNTAGIIDNVPIVQADGTPTPLTAFSRLVDTNLVGTFDVMRHSVASRTATVSVWRSPADDALGQPGAPIGRWSAPHVRAPPTGFQNPRRRRADMRDVPPEIEIHRQPES